MTLLFGPQYESLGGDRRPKSFICRQIAAAAAVGRLLLMNLGVFQLGEAPASSFPGRPRRTPQPSSLNDPEGKPSEQEGRKKDKPAGKRPGGCFGPNAPCSPVAAGSVGVVPHTRQSAAAALHT